MKPKKRDMTYYELHKFLADKYNDYQNTNIYDNYFNYMHEEFSTEMYDYDLLNNINREKDKEIK